MVDEKKLQLEKVHTDKNGVDIMIKALPEKRQGTCQGLAGMYIAS